MYLIHNIIVFEFEDNVPRSLHEDMWGLLSYRILRRERKKMQELAKKALSDGTLENFEALEYQTNLVDSLGRQVLTELGYDDFLLDDTKNKE